VLALTPVAALLFRFNNPDALLVLLLTLAAYAMTRAIEAGRTRWIALAGVLIGFGFLAKMAQAFLVLPPFALAYLVAGPPRLGHRLLQLLAGAGAVIVSAGWWVAAVMLTPAADRPSVGGSTNNSILQLALGYNGLGRLDVSHDDGPGGGRLATGSAPGCHASREDQPDSAVRPCDGGRQLAAANRPDRARGAAVAVPAGSADRPDPGNRTDLGDRCWSRAWCSASARIIHPYHTVALAPAIGASRPRGGHGLADRACGGPGHPGCRVAVTAPGLAGCSGALRHNPLLPVLVLAGLCARCVCRRAATGTARTARGQPCCAGPGADRTGCDLAR
jgi:hypothetical protein